MDQIDIDRWAKLLIDQYGADAPAHASMKADAMLELGDLKGVEVWKRIVRAIAEIQGTEGQTTH
jgi:hypothetical protein